jgi:hypothetical protein
LNSDQFIIEEKQEEAMASTVDPDHSDGFKQYETITYED